MKKIIDFIKRLNPHIVIFSIILLSILGTVFFIFKWAKGIDSTFDRGNVPDGYDIEVLDTVYYMTPEWLNGHVPNETKKVLCFGNAPFADDRDSEDNLCNLIAKETGAEVINVSVPDSYMAMNGASTHVSDPNDFYSFYWLTVFATLKQEKVYNNYNRFARGTSDIGDQVVDYLYELDMNTIDTVVLMYDAADYLDGRIKETSDNLTNPATFCGNMYAGIKLLRAQYPHVQIIVMSPTYAYAIDEDGNYESSDIIKVEGQTLSDYAYTQLNLCLVEEITFIDHIYGTVNCDNADMYLTDNVQLNLEGRKAVASRFSEIFTKTWDRYYEKLENQ